MTDTSTVDLEREAEAVRARISETADQLRAKMTPGQLMDEVLGQFRNGDASRMLDNFRVQARDNPMALALIGSGVAWMLLGSGAQAGIGDSGERHMRGSRSSDMTGYPEMSEATSESSVSTGLGADAESLAARASNAFAGLGSSVGTRMHDASDRMSHMASGMRSAGEDAFTSSSEAAKQFGEQARSSFLDVFEREPLVLAAIGVAVGAAIGAILPATEVEREHLGPAGDAMRDRASALGARGMETAKEAAGEVFETMRNEADRQGLLPGDEPVAPRIGAVVQATSDAIRAKAEGAGSEKGD